MAELGKRAREQAVLLGKHKSIVGILAEPLSTAPATAAPAVVLLNAGIVHRVGPNRMHVLLARELAAAGIVSLRFDMSGLGDSQSRAEATTPLEAAMADIRDALEWLEATKQVRKVILFGLCSGADHSILYASSDRRVAGTVLIDPSLPRTSKYHLYRASAKLSKLVKKSPAQAWSALGSYIEQNLAPNRGRGDADEAHEPELSNGELHALFAQHYRHCVDAGVPLLAVFTGHEPGHYREQLLDAFPDIAFGERLTLEYLPHSDHTFTREADRAWLAINLMKWMDKNKFANAYLNS
jgi:dienelactone hydrolase